MAVHLKISEADFYFVELIRYTVCLGRCPGVRPRHINLAVKMASTVLA
jgi:hypothetical protein